MPRKVDEKATEEKAMPELLWERGPAASKLDEWKSRFKRVYMAQFEEDERFVFRAITREEFKMLRAIKGADQFYLEERMCERCCLWPMNINFQMMQFQKAGIPSSMSELIMEKSGFEAMEVREMLVWEPVSEEFTEEMFLSLKQKHGKLYAVEFENKEIYVFRGLNRKEYKEMQKDEGDPLYQEEKVCEKCVVFPTEYNFSTMKTGDAGIPTTLSELIMSKSGFAATSVQMFD